MAGRGSLHRSGLERGVRCNVGSERVWSYGAQCKVPVRSRMADGMPGPKGVAIAAHDAAANTKDIFQQGWHGGSDECI